MTVFDVNRRTGQKTTVLLLDYSSRKHSSPVSILYWTWLPYLKLKIFTKTENAMKRLQLCICVDNQLHMIPSSERTDNNGFLVVQFLWHAVHTRSNGDWGPQQLLRMAKEVTTSESKFSSSRRKQDPDWLVVVDSIPRIAEVVKVDVIVWANLEPRRSRHSIVPPQGSPCTPPQRKTEQDTVVKKWCKSKSKYVLLVNKPLRDLCAIPSRLDTTLFRTDCLYQTFVMFRQQLKHRVLSHPSGWMLTCHWKLITIIIFLP